MNKCGICNQVKEVKDIWTIPIFQNKGLIFVSIADDIILNNNICEECTKILLDNGRINGKNKFGYRLPLEYQQERYKEKHKR